MPVARERVLLLKNKKQERVGPVLYWMNRDMRLEDNWALIFAYEKAIETNQPLIIVYNLVVGFEKGIGRQHWFKTEALREIEKECNKHSLAFKIVVDTSGEDTPHLILKETHKYSVATIVTDFSPLLLTKKWHKEMMDSFDGDMYEVDAHNIVPARFVSDKREYGAYTLRPKIHRHISTFLTKYPVLDFKKLPPCQHFDARSTDWEALASCVPEDALWTTKHMWKPSSSGAKDALKLFVQNHLEHYGVKRNDPTLDGQSNLSPYLHFGIISAQHIVLCILEATGFEIDMVIDEKSNGAKVSQGLHSLKESVTAFLEELIVRRELGDNFCLHTSHYKDQRCLPDWAQNTLQKHKNDPREYTYTLKEFERAKTHDDAWNACQREMLYTGKMHGYMRMYWAKKILEWTPSVELAFEYAVYLNDTYELDGREPSGYAGIAWALGGVHDRAWFERPVFGQIRYMNREGLRRKFDLISYIKKNSYGEVDTQIKLF